MAQSHVANPLQLEEHSQPYQLALHISISSSLRPLIHTHQRYSKVGFENCRNMDSTWKVEELYLPPKNHKSAEELQTGADRLASWIAKLQSGQNYSFFPVISPQNRTRKAIVWMSSWWEWSMILNALSACQLSCKWFQWGAEQPLVFFPFCIPTFHRCLHNRHVAQNQVDLTQYYENNNNDKEADSFFL